MKLHISRRNLLITGIASVTLAVAAWADGQHVIGFTSPAAFEAGTIVQTTISVDQGTANVTVTSNPAGLVNQTVSSASGTVTATLYTNPDAPAGSYQLIATPVGGGGSYARYVQAFESDKMQSR